MSRRTNRANRANVDRATHDSLLRAAAAQQAQAQAVHAQALARAQARFEVHSADLTCNVFSLLFDREYSAAMRAAADHARKNGQDSIDRLEVLAQVDCRALAEVAWQAGREALIGLGILREDPRDHQPDHQEESLSDQPPEPASGSHSAEEGQESDRSATAPEIV